MIFGIPSNPNHSVVNSVALKSALPLGCGQMGVSGGRGNHWEGPLASPQAHLDTSALENPPRELAEGVTKDWGQQKPGAGGWDGIVPKQVLPTLWRTTQTCLSQSWQSCWMTKRSHPGLSQHGASLWPPSCCQLSWTGAACGCPAPGHDTHGSALDLPGSTGHGRRLHSLAGEGYSE